MGAHAYAMGYFEPQERRTAQITARVPKAVDQGLKDLSRLWTHLEQAKSGDPKAEVSVSDVIVRLLKVGLAGAWAEVGGQPETEEQWKKLLGQASKTLDKK